MMTTNTLLTDEFIYTKIFVIRNQKVMMDSDLAALYRVDTRRLNEQVKRNPERFPEDFMFQLTDEEWKILRIHLADSGLHGGRRKPPAVFTEHGVLMLSSVLTSGLAVAVNIQIMRVYTKIRETFATNKEVMLRLEELEQKVGSQGEQIEHVFGYMYQLLEDNEQKTEEPRKRLGYKT